MMRYIVAFGVETLFGLIFTPVLPKPALQSIMGGGLLIFLIWEFCGVFGLPLPAPVDRILPEHPGVGAREQIRTAVFWFESEIGRPPDRSERAKLGSLVLHIRQGELSPEAIPRYIVSHDDFDRDIDAGQLAVEMNATGGRFPRRSESTDIPQPDHPQQPWPPEELFDDASLPELDDEL